MSKALLPSKTPSKTHLRLFALGVCLSLVLFAGLGLYAAVESRLQNITYEAKIFTVVPEDNCIELAHSMGTPLLRTLQKALNAVPFDVKIDPNALTPRAEIPAPVEDIAPPQPTPARDELPAKTQHLIPPHTAAQHKPEVQQKSEPASPRKETKVVQETPRDPNTSDEPECTARVGVEFRVHNPLAVPMHVEILEVHAKVMKQQLRADQIELPTKTLESSGGEFIQGRIFFTFYTNQVLSASSGLIMRRKVQFNGYAKVVVSVLGGVIQREMMLPVEREITIPELLGSIQGTIQAH